MEKLKPAVVIKRIDNWIANAILVKLSEEVDFYDLFEVGITKTPYVVVSALEFASDTLKPETLIFPAREDGTCYNMTDIVQLKAEMNHEKCLAKLGFEIVD